MRITANRVTLARIFLLPVPVYMLIYGETIHWWIAFGIFVLLGATDFIDGLMARREGPTKLGSLIDPVADKIFVAAIFLSLVAIGLFPAWVVSVLLTREFLVTALRSSVAIRKGVIRTSLLAKMKTIIQMGGCGTIFFTIALSSRQFIWVCLLLSIFFLSVALAYLLKRRAPPFWSLPVFFAFVLVAVTEMIFKKEVNLMLQMSLILLITWVSAIDYLIGSYQLFKRTGMVMGDWWRMAWSMVYGISVAPLVAHFPVIVLPVLISMSLEFGLGGIDNIVALERARFLSLPFILSSLTGLAFAAAVNLSIILELPELPVYYSIGLAVMSFVICGITFGQNAYLFKRSLSR